MQAQEAKGQEGGKLWSRVDDHVEDLACAMNSGQLQCQKAWRTKCFIGWQRRILRAHDSFGAIGQ